MKELLNAAELARTWIDLWNEGHPDEIPLAEDFVHNSPYGRVKGRSNYLNWVKPLAEKNVADLRIKRIISEKNIAAIHFEMLTANGTIQVCDWVTVRDGQILEIYSFYDATDLR